MSELTWAGAILHIDLASIAANYRFLRQRVAPTECAAVVKADAYGLGADRVVPTLADAGCRTFFVATVDEGIALRRTLGLEDTVPAHRECDVYVLNGAPRGAEATLAAFRLRPVLNSLDDVDAWAAFARAHDVTAAAALHVDTGMARLGLCSKELDALAEDPGRFKGVTLSCVMSHLACADEPDHPLNRSQCELFRQALPRLPTAPTSFANSSGIFLGAEYHGSLVRPGAALYGIAPVPNRPNPMAQVVRLKGRILQVREIDRDQTVGYGATHSAARRERIATVAVGYADGYLRSLSNSGSGFIGDIRVPVVGRVSMDLVTFDVSHVPAGSAKPGSMIDLIGPRNPVDSLAEEAGTIGYEMLTSLGRRYHRVYKTTG